MCGIIGHIKPNGGIIENAFNAMRDKMVHRGPDGMDSVFLENHRVALGHRRLSIIDLSNNAAQPMANHNGTVWITFNGEVYNFQELRTQLDEYTFVSSSDTEVILHGYEKWGIQGLLEKLNGMFAFCIVDLNKQKAFVARDRVGIKPLYYYLNEDEFVFASELKSIIALPGFKRQIDDQGLASYFRFRYIIGPHTIYKGCYKLKPGHYLTVGLQDLQHTNTCYWKLEEHLLEKDYTEEEAIKAIKELLNDSVGKMAVAADVPVHTFLSGGIDSSVVTALLKKHTANITAYSVEVEDEMKNEIAEARFVANELKVEMRTSKLNAEVFDAIHSRVIAAYDEPLADSSNIPTYFLCQLTGRHVKVALSGDGGDELFYGYNWHAKFNRLKPEDQSIKEYLKAAYNTFDEATIEQLFPQLKNTEALKREFESNLNGELLSTANISRLDFHTFMVDDVLTKVDTASMAHSLEVRVPFLDHRLVELAFSIDWRLHYKNAELKHLLKESAKGLIPNDTIYKQKKGFSVPSVKWIKADYKHNILNGYASQDNVWNRGYLKQLLSTKLHEEHFWLLYNFERWYAYQFHNSEQPLKPSIFQKALTRIQDAL